MHPCNGFGRGAFQKTLITLKLNIMTKFIDVTNETTEKKETVFLEYLDGSVWCKSSLRPGHFDKVIYLGEKHGEDYFAAYYFNKNKEPVIYKGIKGDEFNNQ